jgi:hypothetical protein
MKLPALLLCLAAFPASAADPQPFASEPFRLEPSPPARTGARDFQDDILTYIRPRPPLEPIHLEYGVPVYLPVGPILIDYGLPRSLHDMDAPGPGYRRLKSKRLDADRNS